MKKFRISKRIRRRICLYASASAAVVSGLSIMSAIGRCELNVIGVGEMFIRVFISAVLTWFFACLTSVISARIDEIERPKHKRHKNYKIMILRIEPEKKPIRKLVI